MAQKLLLVVFLQLCTAPLWALRIVSLLPSNSEILESIGAADDVVGVTQFDRLKSRKGVVNVGDFMQPSIEKIVALHPDMILAGLWSSSHTVPRLKTMGYSVVEMRNESSLDQIYDTIRRLAKVVGRPAAAEPVIRDMRARLTAVRDRAHALPRRLKTYIEIDRPYWTIGGNDFMGEAFAIAGADNLFGDLPRQAAPVSPEIVLQRDPELIISFSAKRDEIVGRPGWSHVKAVRAGYIIDDLFEDDASRPSPRLVVGLESLISKIEALEGKAAR
jgi:iron complex transport system substrate-binding protein